LNNKLGWETVAEKKTASVSLLRKVCRDGAKVTCSGRQFQTRHTACVRQVYNASVAKLPPLMTMNLRHQLNPPVTGKWWCIRNLPSYTLATYWAQLNSQTQLFTSSVNLS